MEIALWVLVGGLAGWAGITFLKYNNHRGTVVSVLIGAAGGLLGGEMLAPLVGAAAVVPEDFSLAALVMAFGTAAAALAASNLLHRRFGV